MWIGKLNIVRNGSRGGLESLVWQPEYSDGAGGKLCSVVFSLFIYFLSVFFRRPRTKAFERLNSAFVIRGSRADWRGPLVFGVFSFDSNPSGSRTRVSRYLFRCIIASLGNVSFS